jgi:hypothetical protein
MLLIRSEFTEQSLASCQVLLDTTKKRKRFRTNSFREADFPQNKVFAQSNLMKCYYDKKDYASSVHAEKVLGNAKRMQCKSDAQIIIARPYANGDEAKASQDMLNC